MPTSMILRFRDLAGPVGSTIARHNDIVTARGRVWWAWWNKPSERIPRNLFAQFKQTLADHHHLDIYLADSGQYLLYKGRLIEIQEADTEHPIPSPNPDQTPEYYRTTPYKAWFGLTHIDQIPPGETETELRKWSYDEIADFTDDPFLLSYQDKQLFNLDEILHRRHRTIYFIQPYNFGHKTHLVETLPKVQPQNFIREPIVGHSSFILHLSDIHFGAKHGFAIDESQPGKRSLARLLIDDLRYQVKAGAPAAVIISGDLTWQAKPEEFESAASFIERLRSELGLEAYHFVVIPGNHDVRWTDDPASTVPALVQFPEEEAKKGFRDFYLRLFGIPPNQFFSHGRRLLLANYVTVDLIGLSSSELEQTHFAGYGYVRREQIQQAAREMGWEEKGPRTAYRVVTMHHHLVPVVPEEEIGRPDKNYSITLDAGQMIHETLSRGVDLIVHGHMHHPFTGAIMRGQTGKKFSPARSLIVNATGSAGVDKDHIPSGINCYTLYNFHPDGVRIQVRAKGPADVSFAEAGDWGCELQHNSYGGLVFKPST
jgi:predicted MPP superfamily phosphohydrolase